MKRAVVLALAATLAGCSRKSPPTRAECDELLDRYVEKLLRANDPSVAPHDVDRLRAEARARAAKDAAFQRCTSEVSREQMDCALHANSADEMERCLVPVR